MAGEMVERLSRALHSKMEHLHPTADGDDWVRLTDRQREFYALCAKHAMLILREPTKEMINVGNVVIKDSLEAHGAVPNYISRETFRAMIDTALTG